MKSDWHTTHKITNSKPQQTGHILFVYHIYTRNLTLAATNALSLSQKGKQCLNQLKFQFIPQFEITTTNFAETMQFIQSLLLKALLMLSK